MYAVFKVKIALQWILVNICQFYTLVCAGKITLSFINNQVAFLFQKTGKAGHPHFRHFFMQT